MALPDARGGLHPDRAVAIQLRLKFRQQCIATSHGTRQAGTYSDHRRRHNRTVLNHVKVVVETGDLKHLHLTQLQALSQCCQMTLS